MLIPLQTINLFYFLVSASKFLMFVVGCMRKRNKLNWHAGNNRQTQPVKSREIPKILKLINEDALQTSILNAFANKSQFLETNNNCLLYLAERSLIITLLLSLG